MTSSSPVVRPFGDRALVVEFEHDLSPAINARARALARLLRDVPGVRETIPTLRSVLIVCDPLSADFTAIAETAVRIAGRLPPDSGKTDRVIEVPVVYGGEAGPDLSDLARRCGMAAGEVIRLHSAQEYLVYMLGFAPGFAYLGIVHDAIRVPRLSSPRLRVPAGSVGVADALTGIYPLQTAGGWRLIGRTPLAIYDPHRADPVTFRPGDRVRFVPVARADFPPPSREPSGAPRAPRHPIFEVIEPGLYTTVQDLGRPGYRALGVPGSGAMDAPSFRIGNLLAGNTADAAGLECTAPGPVLRVLDHATVVIAGADLSPSLDGAALEMWSPVQIRPGGILRFGAPRSGTWAYVAVSGGIDTPPALGSAATYVPGGLGGDAGRRALAGDVFGRGEGARRPVQDASARPPLPGGDVSVRVIPGPQEEWFAAGGLDAFWNGIYHVTVHADRAGLRLEGPVIAHRGTEEMLSDGMLPGAVQVPPGGQPIVIMPDGPTTGGYPKIGVVATADLRLLAQARPGTRVRFLRTSADAARAALREVMN